MDARLAELWVTNAPCSVIAGAMSDEFPRVFSVNSVIGRSHRIGLERRGNPVGARQ